MPRPHYVDPVAARRAGLIAGRGRTVAKIARSISDAPPFTRRQRDDLLGLLHAHPISEDWPPRAERVSA